MSTPARAEARRTAREAARKPRPPLWTWDGTSPRNRADRRYRARRLGLFGKGVKR